MDTKLVYYVELTSQPRKVNSQAQYGLHVNLCRVLDPMG